MSDQPRAYSDFYINAWTVLSIVLAFVFLAMFLFGDSLLYFGQVTWALLRWMASPLI